MFRRRKYGICVENTIEIEYNADSKQENIPNALKSWQTQCQQYSQILLSRISGEKNRQRNTKIPEYIKEYNGKQ